MRLRTTERVRSVYFLESTASYENLMFRESRLASNAWPIHAKYVANRCQRHFARASGAPIDRSKCDEGCERTAIKAGDRKLSPA